MLGRVCVLTQRVGEWMEEVVGEGGGGKDACSAGVVARDGERKQGAGAGCGQRGKKLEVELLPEMPSRPSARGCGQVVAVETGAGRGQVCSVCARIEGGVRGMLGEVEVCAAAVQSLQSLQLEGLVDDGGGGAWPGAARHLLQLSGSEGVCMRACVLSVHLSVCLSVCLSSCLSACPSVCVWGGR